MFLVSVLLDAGAGNTWTFIEPGSNIRLSRSEGLAVASLYMFKNGLFTDNGSGNAAKVDGKSNFPIPVGRPFLIEFSLQGLGYRN